MIVIIIEQFIKHNDINIFFENILYMRGTGELGFKSVVQIKVVEKHRLNTIITIEDEQIINFM